MGRTRASSIAFALLFCALVLYSCTRSESSVTRVQAQPYVRTDGRMGLSLYVLPQFPDSVKNDRRSLQLSVSSPDGNLVWSFQGSRVTFEGHAYYGSSDICMPDGMELPKGLWSVDVAFSDGSSVRLEFDVDYKDSASALERYAELGSAEPWFDENSNLTVIP